jgi:bifunctional non-homologous end joining protein LigD
VDRPEAPTHVVFDLDPGPPAGLREAATVAILIAGRLRAIGLHPVVKTSGARGHHVAARLDPSEKFDRSKAFSRRLAEELAVTNPEKIVARSDREARAGRIYIDWIQNDRNRQLIAPYSPRATSVPQVSTPVTWEEVARAAAGDAGPLRPTFAEVVRRIDRFGDLWAETAGLRGRLPTGG